MFWIVVVLLLAAGYAALYVHDRRQTQHTILRNFPVVGYFRYFAETLGEYMRQYQYLPDWSERPFNRLERAWVYRSAKGVSNLVSFGSENVPPFVFRNAAFPVLDEEKQPYPGKWIGLAEGPGACREPYFAKSFFNISRHELRRAVLGRRHRAVARGETGRHLDGHRRGRPGTLPPGRRLRRDHADGHREIRRARRRGQPVGGPAARRSPRIPRCACSRSSWRRAPSRAKAASCRRQRSRRRSPPSAASPWARTSISPNRHKDIGNISELGQFIARVRTVTGKPVGVKFVVGDLDFLDAWFSNCIAFPEHCPDYVQVDGGEGGSGAAPAPLIDYVGMPITEALSITAAARERHGLRERIRIVASGKLITPDKVAWAMCMGADFVSSARGFMFSLGCIQAMKCGSGKCPTGVTAADPRLIAGLDPTDKAVRVAHYARRVHDEVEMIAHACGLTDPTGFLPRHVTAIERGVGGFRAAQGGD